MKRVIEGVICIILVLFLGCAEEKTGPGNIAGGNYQGDGTFFDKGPRRGWIDISSSSGIWISPGR